MEKIIFAMPGNETLAERLREATGAAEGKLLLRHFPDGESYVRLESEVDRKEAIIVCTLHQPDEKLLPLYFLARVLNEHGASRITLVAPYLAYMRQDKEFREGEAISSAYFAKLLSSFIDELITIDPHLHRRHSMSEIYSIPCTVLHAAPLVSAYIREQVDNPLLVGPDSESEQWVSEVARAAGAPCIILQKTRLGDEQVIVRTTEMDQYHDRTPVLVDDIISTAHTMMETLENLKRVGMKAAVCVGVHPVFAGKAFESLQKCNPADVATCNTIPHISNKIDITPLLAQALRRK